MVDEEVVLEVNQVLHLHVVLEDFPVFGEDHPLRCQVLELLPRLLLAALHSLVGHQHVVALVGRGEEVEVTGHPGLGIAQFHGEDLLLVVTQHFLHVLGSEMDLDDLHARTRWGSQVSVAHGEIGEIVCRTFV